MSISTYTRNVMLEQIRNIGHRTKNILHLYFDESAVSEHEIIEEIIHEKGEENYIFIKVFHVNITRGINFLTVVLKYDSTDKDRNIYIYFKSDPVNGDTKHIIYSKRNNNKNLINSLLLKYLNHNYQFKSNL